MIMERGPPRSPPTAQPMRAEGFQVVISKKYSLSGWGQRWFWATEGVEPEVVWLVKGGALQVLAHPFTQRLRFSLPSSVARLRAKWGHLRAGTGALSIQWHNGELVPNTRLQTGNVSKAEVECNMLVPYYFPNGCISRSVFQCIN